MSFTVVPLHHLTLPPGACIPFGRKFVLQDVPAWLKQDTGFLNGVLSERDRREALAARHALVSEYEATLVGDPDPEWTGPEPRSIQELRFQSAFLANIALWLIQPSPVCFTVGFHALTTLYTGEIADPPFIQLHHVEERFYCHPAFRNNEVSADHVIRAAKVYEILESVSRKNSLRASPSGIFCRSIHILP